MAATTSSTALATRPAAAPPAPAGATLPEIEPQVTRWGPITLGAALAVAAEAMLFAALVGAFLLTRTGGGTWPPKDVHLDNYRGATLLFTVLLTSGMAQWAVHAARHDDQRNTTVGLAMAFGLTLAMADLVWYTVVKAGFGVASSPYATLWYALLGTYLLAALATAVVLVVAGARAIGGQFSSAEHQPVTAAAMQAHAITVAWIVVYLAVWVRK